jgi:spermidine synthase
MRFEELDYQQTALGELILQRRRAVEADGREIVEVKLNGEYLMSSLFVEGEVALTELGLACLTGHGWDVVVGGLGLGYTAAAVLSHQEVARLTVVEALAPVIGWHQRGLVPNGALLTHDRRCRYTCADFFSLARSDGFEADDPGHRFDAILLDIDHTPDALLNPSHADFYTKEGLTRLRAFLKPGGAFALWSNERPEPAFLAVMKDVFGQAEGHVVEFDNPIQDRTAANGIYVAKAET